MANGGDITITLTVDASGYNVTIRNAGEAAERFARGLRGLNRGISDTEGRLRGMTASLRDWTVIIGQARNALNQIAFLTTDWMQTIVKTNSELERLTFLMKGFSSSLTEVGRLAEANKTIKEIFSLAKSSPFNVNTLSDAFVKMKSVGIDPMNGSLQSLTDAVAKFGGTSEIFHRASIAIQQMSGKGVISMEELRQQLGEAVPRAIELMARSMNVSYGELVDNISDGTVAAGPALKAMFGEFERTFGGAAQDMMESFNGQWARMVTLMVELQTQSVGMKGYFTEVSVALRMFNDFLAGPAAAEYANSLGKSMQQLVIYIEKSVDWLYRHRDAIINIGKVLLMTFGAGIALKVFKAFGGAILGATRTISGLERSLLRGGLGARGLGAAFNALNGITLGSASILAAVGLAVFRLVGPLGAAAAAVWALSYAWDSLNGREFKEPLEKIQNNIPVVDQLDMDDRLFAQSQAMERARLHLEKIAVLENEIIDLRAKGAKEPSGLLNTLKDTLLNSDGIALSAKIKQVEFYQAQVDEIDKLLEGSGERLFDQAQGFFDLTAARMSDETTRAFRESTTFIQQELDSNLVKISSSMEMGSQEALNASIAALEESGVKFKQAAEAQIADLAVSLTSKDKVVAEAAKRTIATINAEILRNQDAVQGGIDSRKLGLSLVSGDGSGGSGEKADSIKTRIAGILKNFERFRIKLANEAEQTRKELDAAFDSFVAPDSSGTVENRLEPILNELEELAKRSDYAKQILQQLRGEFNGLIALQTQVDLDEIFKDLKDGTKEMQRAMMGTTSRAQSEFDEQAAMLEDMKRVLLENDQWNINREMILQDRLTALREQKREADLGGLSDFSKKWEDFGLNMYDAVAGSLESLSGALADFIFDGKAGIEDLAKSLIKSMAQIAINASISKLTSMVMGSFGGAPGAPATAQVAHSGGIAGMGGRSSAFSSAMFSGAPRFHTGGVAGQEVPAILEKGEGIFTKGQMKAIGAGMSSPSVTVNLTNASGQAMEAEASAPRMDANGMILDVVLRAVGKPGRFRDNMKAAMR
jgi:tape measure domain-containing protein